MGLSKLAEKCKKCPKVDTCDHKKMEAVGFLQREIRMPSESGTNTNNGLKVTESGVTHTLSNGIVVGIIGEGATDYSTLVKLISKQFEQGLGGNKNGKK